MTKANALRGWRSPEEKPVEGETLLVVFGQKKSGIQFVSQQVTGLELAKSDDEYEVLAWQYSPVWDYERKE